jgi:hypothetical protein
VTIAPAAASESNGQRQESIGFCLLSIVVIGGLFLAVSLLSSPTPGVNEPHYLCKARAFSDPAWCDRDFFLTSTNAHYCFFWLVGPLTQHFSFDTVALFGRVASALMLAIGWTVLGRAIGLSATSRIMAAGAFAFLSQLGSFSGEWLLGGFESKVAAWGLGLCAAGFWIRGTLKTCPGWMASAGICCGAGAMLHPVVGGWIAVCICMAWMMNLVTAYLTSRAKNVLKSVGGIAAFSIATIIVALPGLVPALRLVLDNSLNQKDRELALFIQVFWRLKHHLDPTELMASQWIYAAALLTTTIVVTSVMRRRWNSELLNNRLEACKTNQDMGVFAPNAAIALLLKFFLASAFIAFAGVLIGWHFVAAKDMNDWQWRAALLKFYPFRTFDALLPIVAGLLTARLLQCRSACSAMPEQQLIPHAAGSVVNNIFTMAIVCGLPFVPATLYRSATPPGYTDDQYADWQQACQWIRAETPGDALILTPRESCAFKWMAERAEYVCYKDCPQDAAGILEWNRRLWWLHDWTLNSSMDGVYDTADLQLLRFESECDFIVTRILGPFEARPVWQGKHWQVIAVP